MLYAPMPDSQPYHAPRTAYYHVVIIIHLVCDQKEYFSFLVKLGG